MEFNPEELVSENQFDVEFLKTLTTNEQLIDLVYASKMLTPEFIVEENHLPPSLASKLELTLEDIMFYIDYKTKLEENTIISPILDQRKWDFFKNKYFGVNKPNALPGKGFFWQVGVTVKDLGGFGVFETMIFIKKIPRLSKDNRVAEQKIVWKEEKAFYYDFKEKKYKQAEKKGESDNTLAYKSRVESIEYAYSVFELENQEHVKELHNLYEKTRPFERAQNTTKSDITEEFKIRNFLNYFVEPLENIKLRLPIKLLFAHVDVKEFEYLKLKVEELAKEIEIAIEKIENQKNQIITEYEKLYHENSNTFRREMEKVQKLKFGELVLSDWQDDYRFATNVSKLFRDLNKIINSLVAFVRPRTESSLPGDGFCGMSKTKLYPNIVYVENRVQFTDYYMSDEKRIEMEKEILEILQGEANTSEVVIIDDSKIIANDNIYDDDNEFIKMVLEHSEKYRKINGSIYGLKAAIKADILNKMDSLPKDKLERIKNVAGGKSAVVNKYTSFAFEILTNEGWDT